MSAPTEGQWDWFLHVAGDRSDVHIHGTADSLEDAKAQFKAEYEKWLAKNGRNKLK